MKYDIFISHASEDKDDVARPIAEELASRDVKVWLDECELTLGDSLRRSIDAGLANSRFGLVVLSPNFFAKEWPQKELDALVAREDGKEKVILPVWHNVRRKDILEFSPLLADKLAVSSAVGIDNVVQQILAAMQRNVIALMDQSSSSHKLSRKLLGSVSRRNGNGIAGIPLVEWREYPDLAKAIIGTYVAERRRGRYWMALCLFVCTTSLAVTIYVPQFSSLTSVICGFMSLVCIATVALSLLIPVSRQYPSSELDDLIKYPLVVEALNEGFAPILFVIVTTKTHFVFSTLLYIGTFIALMVHAVLT